MVFAGAQRSQCSSEEFLMRRLAYTFCILFCCPAVLTVVGCTNDAQPRESSGSLELNLELVGSVSIEQVSYEITGNDIAPMSGTIDTSAPGATASVEVFGIPPDDDYLVEMTATSADGETACQGSAAFDIRARQVTTVMVMLNCTTLPRFGSARVDGSFNVCADLQKVVISPLETSVGSEIDVLAVAADLEDDSVEYHWTSTSGSFANPHASQTTFVCEEAGVQTITIEVSDDAFGACVGSWTVQVVCGAPPMEGGKYLYTCVLSALPIPLPVGIQIHSFDPGFRQGEPSNLTTLLNYSVAPPVINLLPGLAPDAMFDIVDCSVGVSGGTPTSIFHTAEGLPFAPVGEFDSDQVTTEVTPTGDATELSLALASCRFRLSGLPLSLVPGGVIDLISGEGGCGAMEAVEGSGPLTFPVESDGMGGTGGAGGAAGTGGVGGMGGTGGAGGFVPGACEDSAATALQICVKSLNDTRRLCYVNEGAPCASDDPEVVAALDSLESTVSAACPDGSGLLSENAFVRRLQTACASETLSLASRTFGGPHGAVWAKADPSVAESCLRQPHLRVTEFMDAALSARNECLQSDSCNAEALAAQEATLANAATADVVSMCDYLDLVIALKPAEYVSRTRAQLDCLTAFTHDDGDPIALWCGPAVVERDPPPAPAPNGYMNIVLDSDVYGTRCGGDVPLFPADNPYAFHVKLAPEGYPIENVLIYLEGGGVCLFDDEEATTGNAGCYSRYLEDPGLFEAIDNEPWTHGIMSDDPAISPFANWTKVFLPYCTQDLHMGGGVTSNYPSITVHRYGAINTRTALRYVRDLIWRELDARGGEGFRPDRIRAAFAGFSAGGWGVLYNYHWVLDDLQWPHTAAFPDSALALNNIYDAFWNVEYLSRFVLDGPEPYYWGAKANQPPYCFGTTCVVGPQLLKAHSPRLKAVPEQQYMIISNQNDEDGQMATSFFDRNTTFDQGRVNWINEARRSYCETRELRGIRYFFMPFAESLHSTTMSDYYLSQVPVAGQTMRDWMADGFSNPDAVANRTEEGNLVSSYPGVDPFPCTLP
jgi:hypothetical protein